MANRAATGRAVFSRCFLLRCGLGLALGLGLGWPAWGQSAAPPPRPDSTLLATAARSLSQRYTAGLGYESGLYNGPLYTDYVRPGTQGHRFFGSAAPQLASLTYAGYPYEGVPLRYDLIRDQLVLTAPSGSQEMTLVNELVAGFVLNDHVFTRLVAADSSAGSPVRTGFYEVLVAGPVRLLAAHHKALQKRSSGGRVESEITASDAYFVETSHHYYAVEKAGALLALFPEHKAALRQYSRANHLSFRPDARAQALAALVRYEATLASAGR